MDDGQVMFELKLLSREELFDKRWRLTALLVPLLLAVLTTCPLFVSFVPQVMGHDVYFQLLRIEAVARGLSEGIFPVRLYETQAYGFGYPTGICYPDAFLYLPAALRMLGVSLKTSYTLFVFLCNFVTASLAIYAFSRMFGSRMRGLVCATLWTLASYRLMDVLVRGSVGEYLALMFGPLLALGVWSLFDAEGVDRRAWIWIGLACAGIVHSHVLSVVLYALVGLPFVTVALVTNRGRGVVKTLAKAVLLATLLSASFVVPFLDYYLGHDLNVGFSTTRNTPGHAIEPGQLLAPFWPFRGYSIMLGEQLADEMPLGVGWELLIGVVLAIALLAYGGRELWRADKRNAGALVALLVASAAVLVATTYLFPWSRKGTGGVLGWLVTRLSVIQFPWRLLGQASLLLVILWGIVLHYDHSRIVRGGACLALVLALLECGFAGSTLLQSAGVLRPGDASFLDGDTVMSGEYLPADFNRDAWRGKWDAQPVASSDDVVVRFEHENAQSSLVELRNSSAEEVIVRLPLFYHQQLRIDAASQEGGETPSLSEGEGCAVLSVPAGYQGTVRVQFVEPASWRIAEVVSLVSLIALVAYALPKSRRRSWTGAVS